MEKRLLRKIHMEKLARLEDDIMHIADEKICRNIMSLDAYKRAEKLFLYVSVGKEVDTYAIIRDAITKGKQVYIPICHGGGIMSAARLFSENDLVEGRYGIPTVSPSAPVISPEELDLILVPGVCFDKTGNRLGRGGGYYDRYLANDKLEAALVGVCRSEQLVDILEVDVHDKKVDILVSDTRVIVM